MKYLNEKQQPLEDTEKLNLESTPQSIQKTNTQVTTKHTPDKKKRPKRRFQLNRVSLTDKMLFLDNLSIMLKAGLSLAPALNTLNQEIKNKYLKEIIIHFKNRIENGQLLSTGMKEYSKIFSEMIIATVEVGENTGMLSDTLGNLAEILKAQKKLRSKVLGALMYPIIVLLALVGVSLFLALYIFPQLIAIFEESGVKLPIILTSIRAIIHVLQLYGWYILIGGVSAFVGLLMIFKLSKPRLWLHYFLLKIPFVGKIIKELALTRFTSNLQALLASGLSIVKSLEIVAKTLNNLHYRRNTEAMAKELEKGIALAKSMAARPGIFPSLTIQLCQVGEETGELDSILTKISKFYEDRVNDILANLSTIIEPILLVLVGIAVGFIAVSIIGPMYELTNSFA